MSDIALEFDVGDLLLLVVAIGWPGLLVGAGIGAWAWRERRWFGSAIGGTLGLCVLAAARLSLVWPLV